MASSSSNPISSSTPTRWHVFLSFRGEDTRQGFISHLYEALCRNGIRTFKDEPEGLQAGDVISSELRNAIKQSKIYIVVLSKNYASSGWCLDELAEIAELWKSWGRLVLPIFYHIEPSVTRHQNASFEEDFKKHEGRVAMELVNKWRGALKDVAGFSGYHLRDKVQTLCVTQTGVGCSDDKICQNRHLKTEADIVKDVVDRVLHEIKLETQDEAHIINDLVAIDSHVADIKSLLVSSSTINGVHWIGIHGMGGVGKTTLAKAFHSQMFRSFDGSCFLESIKDVCEASKGLKSLQQQLINGVLKRKTSTSTKINSIDHGICLIRDLIVSLKVLVVLDDIDHQDQVKYLVGKFLAAGSVIVLTTRNGDLLDKLGVKNKYKVNILDADESLQLFNQHAFEDTEIKPEFMEMSDEILCYAGGLPLALKVFGSSLNGAEKGAWELFIDKLQKLPIDSEVECILKISYDGLESVHPQLQALFLDIACFFIGDVWEYADGEDADAVAVLETYYDGTVNECISLLQNRNFITIEKKMNLFSLYYTRVMRMHDLIRGMAKKIAGNSRLVRGGDIRNVLENNKGTKAIEGMVDLDYYDDQDPDDEEYEDPQIYSCDAETFDRMPNLRFLRLRYVHMSGSFGKPFKNLRWLCWYHCSNLPSNFCAQKLVILELRDNSISRFGENALVLGNLKILYMSRSKQLSKTPDFNGLPCLETLNLSECGSLVEVDVSIGNLEQLATLDLSFCKCLRSLPESICKLRALETLNLIYCSSLGALPLELGNIESLTELDAKGTHILNLPNSIGRLSRLVRLSVSLCMDPTTLPDIICKLSSLEILEIDYFEGPEELVSGNNTQLSNQQLPSTLKQLEAHNCKSLLKLPDLSNLQQLVEMRLSGCSNLQEVEGLEKFISLELLDLGGCTSMKRLPDLSDLQKLKYLSLQGCSILTEIEGLEDVLSLINIDLRDCISLKRLPNLSNHQQLKYLTLKGCSILTEIQGLEEVISLTLLYLRGCTSLYSLPDLSKLQKLWTLELTDCSSLTDIQGFGKLISIKELHLEGCTSMNRLPDLSDSQNLKSLRLKGSSSLREMEGLDKLISIEKLYLEGCTSMNRLPDLSGLQNLKSLWLEGSSSLREMEGLDKLISIEELYLEGCTLMERLPDLSDLQKLKSLTLKGCSILTEIEGLEDVLSLTIIDLSGCISLKRFPNLSKLQQLKIVHLSDCIRLTEIQGLEEVISLIELDLCGCTSLYSLPDLSKLQKLWTLELTDCSSLTDIQGFGKLISIKELHLEGCTSMNRLPDLSGLQNLKSLRLMGSSSLREMEGLDKLISMEKLYLEGCTSMNRLPDLSGLQNLKSLWLEGSSSLREMEGLDKLISIEELYLEGCTLMERLPDLSDLQKLKSLTLKGCSFLTEMEGLDKLISIEELHLEGCTSMNRLPDLSGLQNLKSLRLEDSSSLTEMEGLDKLISIEELHLEGCTSMNRLPDLSSLQNLKSLRLEDSSSLTEMEGLDKLISIEELHLEGCTSMNQLPNLSGLKILNSLRLKGSSSLRKIEGLEDVLSVTIIDLSGCISLKRFPNLSNLQQLQTLQLTDCSHLTGIEGLEDVLSITVLDLSGCIFLNRLPNLSNLQKLWTLNLTDCCSLTEIQGLGEAINITTLNCGGCKALERLPNLSKLQQLETLLLSDCISLTEIEGLEDAISIISLDLSGCISLRRLPNISNLQKLSILNLTGCSIWTEIEGVDRFISSGELYILNVGPSDGEVCDLEPLESEGVPPPHENVQINWDFNNSVNENYVCSDVELFVRSLLVDTPEFNADLTLGWNTNDENRACKKIKLDEASSSKTKK